MKKHTTVTTLAAGSFALIGLVSLSPLHAQDSAVETEDQKISYGLGMMIGEQLKQFGDVDFDLFMQGLQAQNGDGETAITVEEAQAVLQTRQQELMEAQRAEDTAASSAFLEENAAREEVSTTDSGLQYEVLEDSDGEKPAMEDTVVVHYVGTLTDGTEFDSSVARGEPATFPLKGVIPGWTEGLQLMPVGSKYRFVIPSELAYGDRGAPPAIGPNATLVFEVELLEIAE